MQLFVRNFLLSRNSDLTHPKFKQNVPSNCRDRNGYFTMILELCKIIRHPEYSDLDSLYGLQHGFETDLSEANSEPHPFLDWDDHNWLLAVQETIEKLEAKYGTKAGEIDNLTTDRK